MEAETESSILHGIAFSLKDMEYPGTHDAWPGTFSIIPNHEPDKIYWQYKPGEEVEQMFDTMKDEH